MYLYSHQVAYINAPVVHTGVIGRSYQSATKRALGRIGHTHGVRFAGRIAKVAKQGIFARRRMPAYHAWQSQVPYYTYMQNQLNKFGY